MPIPNLSMFLNRPLIVDQFSWSSTNAFKSLLTTIEFPKVLRNMGVILSKLSHMMFYRPDIQITIRTNGTKMHLGRFVVGMYYQQQGLGPAYTNYASMFSTRWRQVEATNQQVVTFQIPFKSYKDYLTLTIHDTVPLLYWQEAFDLFTLNYYVSIPLSSVNELVPAPIEVTTYANFINPQLAGYTHESAVVEMMSGDPSDSMSTGKAWSNTGFVGKSDNTSSFPTAQIAKPPAKESEKSTKSGTSVSRWLGVAADMVYPLRRVPVIGGFADAASYAFSSFSSLFQAMGMSVPVNNSLLAPMQISQPRFLQCEDTPHSRILAPIANASTTKDASHFNVIPHELTILGFCQRPALIYTGQITTSNAPGATLFKQTITPRDLIYYDYSTPIVNPYVGTPLQFMSRFFRFWRGSIKFYIHFNASFVHSCRVGISYVPGTLLLPLSSFTLPDIDTRANTINEVWDIGGDEGSRDYSFTVPFMQATKWLAMPRNGISLSGSELMTQSNGYFTLQVINTLTSGGSIPVVPIYYQIFAAAGQDFQFSVPTTETIEALGLYNGPAGDASAVVEMEVGACKFPTSSMACLTTMDCPVLGGISFGVTNHNLNMSYEVTGIRHLCNLLTKIVSSPPVATTVLNVQNVGGYIDFNLPATPDYRYSYLFQMMTVFRYWSGSIRYCVIGDQASTASVNVQTDTVDPGFVSWSGATAVSPYGAGGAMTQAQAIFPNTAVNPCDITVPKFTRNNCNLTAISGFTGVVNTPGLTTFYTDPQKVTFAIKYLSTPNLALTAAGFLIYMGAGDDFFLGEQMGIPLANATLA